MLLVGKSAPVALIYILFEKNREGVEIRRDIAMRGGGVELGCIAEPLNSDPLSLQPLRLS